MVTCAKLSINVHFINHGMPAILKIQKRTAKHAKDTLASTSLPLCFANFANERKGLDILNIHSVIVIK